MRKTLLSCVAALGLVASVQISPSGKYLAMLRITTKEGNPYIEIYDTADMSKAFRRMDADPMEFVQINWVNDDFLFGTASKIVRKRVSQPEEDVRSYRAFSYSIKDNKFKNIDGNFGLENILPADPDNIIIQAGRAVGNALSDDPFERFRPSAYYKFNLKKGSRSLILKGNEKIPQASFDIDGNPVFSQGFENSTKEIVNYYRTPGDSEWKEFARVSADTSDVILNDITYIKAKKGDPNTAIVLANNGNDKTGLWEFNLATGEFGKLIYRRTDSDVVGTVRHSMSWAGRDDIVAAVYPGAKSYYLIKDGKAAKIGSQNPLLKPSDLANVEFIKYPARDGKMIPGYVTTPNTPGPHPLIVLPHGGPYINEVIVYDEWAQLLANNGYMVLQPQYRGGRARC